MAKVKSGLSRPKTEPRFKSRRPKVTVIVAHVHGAPLADVARTLQTAVCYVSARMRLDDPVPQGPHLTCVLGLSS